MFRNNKKIIDTKQNEVYYKNILNKTGGDLKNVKN